MVLAIVTLLPTISQLQAGGLPPMAETPVLTVAVSQSAPAGGETQADDSVTLLNHWQYTAGLKSPKIAVPRMPLTGRIAVPRMPLIP